MSDSYIRNLHTDPLALNRCDVWRAVSQKNGNKFRYELQEGAPSGYVFCWSPMDSTILQGKVLYVRVTSGVSDVLKRLSVENATVIARGNEWVAARVPDDNTGNHTVGVTVGPFVLQERAVYTPEDWEHVYRLYQKNKLVRPFWATPASALGYDKRVPLS